MTLRRSATWMVFFVASLPIFPGSSTTLILPKAEMTLYGRTSMRFAICNTRMMFIREKREPLDRMLQAMQIFESRVKYYEPGTTEQPNPNHDEAKYLANVQRMVDTAAKAAPYVHHRLATMVHNGPNNGAIQSEAIDNALAKMSDEDLNALGRLLEPLAAAARVTPGVADSSRAGNPWKKH